MAAAKITADQLAEYTQLEEQRKELDRQSRAIAKQQGILSDHFRTELEKSGAKSTARGAYRVALVESRGAVAWKDELIKEIGPLKVAEIAETAPVKIRVQVETVDAKPAKRAA
jgi:hypothetical protein